MRPEPFLIPEQLYSPMPPPMNRSGASRRVVALLVLTISGILLLARPAAAQSFDVPRKVDGYRGIWFTLGQFSEYGDKYSGGLGTYTSNHLPLAIHAPEAGKTFFVYGGTTTGTERHLLAMVSYYDHATGMVPRPTVVHDKQGVDDPHDNPTLAIDERGHLWVFVNGRGRVRPAFIYRSTRPYDIDAFELIEEMEMAYPQPWWVDGHGFLVPFTRYTHGRELYWTTSPDGRAWTEPRKLVSGGHYQVSALSGERLITAFNTHLPAGNVDTRTNLYFLQTTDMGRTWSTIDGTPVAPPLDSLDNAALVRDYRREERLVYLMDITFDGAGDPVVLYLTSRHHQPGPAGEPRTWTVARWTDEDWVYSDITTSHHNYDVGSLYIEDDGTWSVIGPSEPGPQYWGTGGEIAAWRSLDQGATWEKVRDLTRSSERNHTYVRRPIDAHPDFYAFWADGDPDGLSMSRLYFSDRAGNVSVLPYEMDAELSRPERLPTGGRN